MKPAFALNLDHHRVALLQRVDGGWDLVGDVRLDDPELDRGLRRLRKAGVRRAQGAITSKLILPSSQILYATIAAPGPDARSRRTQIRAALAGMTPYAVDDLVFDWSGTGASVQVAVVARETLDEAEAFATAHRFAPVSFVAVPEAGQFGGEPWFGITQLADKILPEADRVMRDNDPVRLPPTLAEGVETSAAPPAPAPAPAPDPEVDLEVSPLPATGDETVVAVADRFTLIVATEDGVAADDRPEADGSPKPEVPFASRRQINADPAGVLAAEPGLMAEPRVAAAREPVPVVVLPGRAGKVPPLGVLLAAGLVALAVLFGGWALLRPGPEVTGQNDSIASGPRAPDALQAALPEDQAASPDAEAPAPGVGSSPPVVVFVAPEPDSVVPPNGTQKLFLPTAFAPDAPAPPPAIAPLAAALPPTGFDAGLPHGTFLPFVPAPLATPPAAPAPAAGLAGIAGAGRDPAVAAKPPADTDTGARAVAALAPDLTPETQALPTISPPVAASEAALAAPTTTPPAATPERPVAANPETTPETTAEVAVSAANPALARARPRARPESAVSETAPAAPAAISALAVATARAPRARPARLVADLAAEAAARAAAAATAASAAAITASPRPDDRPRDLATAISPEAEDEPETKSAAPRLPTRASVAAQATVKKAVNLREINLIGVFGDSTNRRALVRMPNGKMVGVRVGDRFDGGQVATIDKSRLIYVKRGRSLVLELPKG